MQRRGVSGSAEGNRDAYKHGRYTAQAIDGASDRRAGACSTRWTSER